MTPTTLVPRPPRTPAASSPALPRLLERATREGIITPEQAERLRALGSSTAATAPDVAAPSRVPALVAEALGYVGAVLVGTAAVVLGQQFWADLTPWAHATLLGILTVILLVSGALVSGAPGTPYGRLGSVLWLGAVGMTVGTANVVAGEVLALEESALGVAVSAPTTIVAAVLWSLRRRTLQQIPVVVGVAATTVTTLLLVELSLESWSGLVVWSIGVAWMVLGWAELVPPNRTARVLGASVALVGALMAPGASGRWGLLLGLVTAAGLVAVSVPARETALLALGVIGLFLFVPRAAFAYFGEQVGAPLALFASGGLLLGIALWVARVRRDDRPPGR